MKQTKKHIHTFPIIVASTILGLNLFACSSTSLYCNIICNSGANPFVLATVPNDTTCETQAQQKQTRDSTQCGYATHESAEIECSASLVGVTVVVDICLLACMAADPITDPTPCITTCIKTLAPELAHCIKDFAAYATERYCAENSTTPTQLNQCAENFFTDIKG